MRARDQSSSSSELDAPEEPQSAETGKLVGSGHQVCYTSTLLCRRETRFPVDLQFNTDRPGLPGEVGFETESLNPHRSRSSRHIMSWRFG